MEFVFKIILGFVIGGILGHKEIIKIVKMIKGE